MPATGWKPPYVSIEHRAGPPELGTSAIATCAISRCSKGTKSAPGTTQMNYIRMSGIERLILWNLTTSVHINSPKAALCDLRTASLLGPYSAAASILIAPEVL